MEEERQSLIKTLKNLDHILLGSLGILFVIGLMSIYSAGSGLGARGMKFLCRQAMWGGISVIAFLAVLRIGYRRFLKWAYPLYGVTVGVLIIVLIAGLTAKGAQSWLTFGPFRLQPSEFGKIVLALVLAKYLHRNPPGTLYSFTLPLLLAAVSGILILVQPDLGSALVYGVMTLMALVISGAKKRHVLLLLGSGLAMLPLGWNYLKGYQKLRLMVFIKPSLDPLGAGYNVIQSRIAVGSGKLLGKGFLAGTQSKLRFLPEPHTDFIFSVFAEEFGFIGTMAVLLLFGILFWRVMNAALRTKDLQAKIMVSALSAWIWFQLFESVGMSMGLMPVTGLPMPLLSYGGSALLSMVIAFALVTSVYISTLKPYE